MENTFSIFWSEIEELGLPAYAAIFEEDDFGILDVYAVKTKEGYIYWHCLNTCKALAQPGMECIHLVNIHIVAPRYKDGVLQERDIYIYNKHETLDTVQKNVLTNSIILDIINNMPPIHHNPDYTVDEGLMLKMTEINDTYNEAFNTIVINYPDQEVASFPLQVSQAKEYMANPNTDVKFIRLLHAGRVSRGYNETLEELCVKILTKASMFEPISGYLSGIRQALEKEIEIIVDRVTNGEISHYKGYKECMNLQIEYPIPTMEQFLQMISPVPTNP